jgi:hypothetical protein
MRWNLLDTMKSAKAAIAAVILIAVVAVLFLAPIVPYSKVWATGTTQSDTFPSMSCSGANNLTDPVLVYYGYESITAHFTGVGAAVYTRCSLAPTSA